MVPRSLQNTGAGAAYHTTGVSWQCQIEHQDLDDHIWHLLQSLQLGTASSRLPSPRRLGLIISLIATESCFLQACWSCLEFCCDTYLLLVTTFFEFYRAQAQHHIIHNDTSHLSWDSVPSWSANSRVGNWSSMSCSMAHTLLCLRLDGNSNRSIHQVQLA